MLTEHVDTLITIPNQKLLLLGDDDLTFIDAFRKADEVLYQAVKGISDLITQNGIVNVDFADVKTVMSNMGRALMGTGCRQGPEPRAPRRRDGRHLAAPRRHLASRARPGVLINIVGGPDLKMNEIQEAATLVQEQAHEDANIIFGASIDETLGENVKVTVIATGFDSAERAAMEEAQARASMPASMTVPSGQRAFYGAPSSTMRPQAPEVPALAPRRTNHAHEARAQAAQGQGRLPMRERTVASFPTDMDWDIPAFQRKGQ